MFAITGFSILPVFVRDSLEVVSIHSVPGYFRDYVYSLYRGRWDKAVVFESIPNIKYFYRRIVFRDKAFNPSTYQVEFYPRKTYVYPSKKPIKTFNNSIVLGIRLKGVARKPLFIPLYLETSISLDDVCVLERVLKRKPSTLSLNDLLGIITDLGVEVLGKSVYNNNIGLLVRDRVANLDYALLIDNNGYVIDTNVCIETTTPYHLLEFILYLRNNYEYVYVYSSEGYPWIPRT